MVLSMSIFMKCWCARTMFAMSTHHRGAQHPVGALIHDSVGKFKKWGKAPLSQRLFPSWWGIPTTLCAEEKENIPSKVAFPNRVIHYAQFVPHDDRGVMN